MSIDDKAVMSLRREIYGERAAQRSDLARLVDLGRAEGADASPAFAELLCDVARDTMLNDVDPPKYVRKADADWLTAHLSRDGGGTSAAEMKMLIQVIGGAVCVPASLQAFALALIEREIVGAAMCGAGFVAPEKLEALRLLVYAGVEGGSLHVSRDSAEALFRIADALADGNDQRFDDFFAKAIGNYLMGVAFRRTPPADAVRAAEDWLDAPNPGFRDFVGSMLAFDRLADASPDARDAQDAADAQEMAHAEVIDPAEADWLVDRLNRDARLSSAEKRLLRFLKAESPQIAPALAALMEKAA